MDGPAADRGSIIDAYRERNGVDPRTATSRLLYWRWPVLLGALAVIGVHAHSWVWAAGLAVPLLAGMLAVHLFAHETVEIWLARGWLLLADGLLVGLALLGVGSLPAHVFLGFFSVVLIAIVTHDRLRTVVASGALLAAMAAIGDGTTMAPLSTVSDALLLLPLLGCAAISFGAVAERVDRRTSELTATHHPSSELWALLEIGETIGSTLELGQVMRSVVQRVGDLVDTDSCTILLADPNLDSGFVLASKGHPDAEMLELKLADYPEIRHALETRQPVLVQDVESHPLVAEVRSILLEKGYRSLLVIPLVYGREVLGALFLRAEHERSFRSDEVRFCKIAANASANALKNALLYRDVSREAELHRSTGEKLRRVLDGTPDMILATDSQGRVTEANQGTEKLLGIPAGQILQRPIAEVLQDESLARGREVENGEEGLPVDVRIDTATGQSIEIALVSAPLCDADGATAGRVWIGRDVTKLRRVEKRLVQAERLSSLGEVVAGVAHELNNPLSGVVGYAELLRGNAVDPSQLRDLERIVESAMRCQKIVFKLLSFARKHPPERKFQNLNDCVTKVLDLKSYHLRSCQIQTELELDPDLPWTLFDFHQTEQVILNLLNNAEQAAASNDGPGRIVLRTGRRGDELFLKVQDNGPGVARAARERIFDPFFTTKEIGQGTGLGLSVSYGILEEHGGRIELDPDGECEGASFTMWLPIQQPEELKTTDSTVAIDLPEGPLRGKSILVAEDEAVVLELFARMLNEAGARVTLAGDGNEAWDRLNEQEFDLIVTDLRMPNLSGQQLYDRVAAERPDLLRRFVFATGDLVREESVQFLKGLPNRIVTKPLEIETVKRVLSQALARLSP